MKDEIKEIREYIACPQFGDDHYGKWGALRVDQRKKIKDLLDYITNLQEENERLKNRNEFLEKVCVGFDDKYENYKSRNEKAKSLTNRTIEIIKQQPSENDEWILERLNGINYCLGGDEE